MTAEMRLSAAAAKQIGHAAPTPAGGGDVRGVGKRQRMRIRDQEADIARLRFCALAVRRHQEAARAEIAADDDHIAMAGQVFADIRRFVCRAAAARRVDHYRIFSCQRRCIAHGPHALREFGLGLDLADGGGGRFKSGRDKGIHLRSAAAIVILSCFGADVVGIRDASAGGRGGGIPDQRLHWAGAFAGERLAAHHIVLLAIAARIVVLLDEAETDAVRPSLKIGKAGFGPNQRRQGRQQHQQHISHARSHVT